MIFEPLQFKFDEVHFGEKKEKITEVIYHKEDHATIGEIQLYLINADHHLKGYVDQYRGEHYCNWYPMDIFHSIEFDYDHCFIKGKVAYLSLIEINEEIRGNGIGTDVMNCIISYLTKQGYDYLILQPSVLRSSNDAIRMDETFDEKRTRQRLGNFYARFGFYRVPTRNELKYPIYYKGLQNDYILREVNQY